MFSGGRKREKGCIENKWVKEVCVSLVNQRHFYFVVLSNFFFFLGGGGVHPFGIKYGVAISKPSVTNMGGLTPFVTKRYIWVSGVEKKKTEFLASRDY